MREKNDGFLVEDEGEKKWGGGWETLCLLFHRRRSNVDSSSLFLSLSFSLPKKMSGRPTDHLEPAAKKRGADRQLTKNEVGDSDDESGGEEVCIQLRALAIGNGSLTEFFISILLLSLSLSSLRFLLATLQRRPYSF